MLAGFTFEQGSAIRTTSVGEEALPGWLAHHESREWISTVGFQGEPGAFAGLPMTLPEGTYFLESGNDELSPTDFALGWAALYLAEFVSTSTRWAHLDIVAANPAAKPGRPERGEATGMRALYTDIRQLYA